MHTNRSSFIIFSQTLNRITFVILTGLFATVGLLAVSAIVQPVNNASAATTGEACFAFDSTTGTITDYYSNEGNDISAPACPRDAEIPSTIGGVAVIAIGDRALQGKQLTSIVIPGSVVTIDQYAFSGNRLTSLVIPDGVKTVGERAFASNQLTNLQIASSVTDIGFNAFRYNNISTLPDYFYDPAVTTIYGIFSDNKFTELAIPNNIKTIGMSAFWTNPELRSLSIPDSVTDIGAGAFMGASITSVVIPDSVVSIGDYAFYYSPIETLHLGTSVTTIGGAAFTFGRLTTLTIPDSVTAIGEGAFAYNSLQTIYLGAGTASLRGDEFDMQLPLAYLNGEMTEEELMNSFEYTRVYTADPANPAGIQDAVICESADDGSYFCRGYLVNPASTTVNYRSSSGGELAPTVTFTGLAQDGSHLNDYLAKNNLPASTSQTDIDAMRARYYRIGEPQTITPPVILGYTVDGPDGPFTITPTRATTEVNLTYYTPEELEQRNATRQEPAGAASSSTSGSGLAATGSDVWLIATSSIAVVVGGAVLAWRRIV